MKLFDKKFVYFMWDDELEGKEVIVANYISSLRKMVENGEIEKFGKGWDNAQKGIVSHSEVDEDFPFEVDGIDNTLAYYDPNYEAKKAFNEGQEIQFKDDVSGEWCSAYNPRWDLNIEYRIKPAEDEKKHYRPYKSSVEMVADFIARFNVKYSSYAEPLIWIKGKETDARYLIDAFRERSVRINCERPAYDFVSMFEGFVYLDGSPVGMEE